MTPHKQHNLKQSSLTTLVTLLLSLVAIATAQVPLRYSIVEDSTSTFVGDVIQDSGLSQEHTQSDLELMNFVFVESDEARETRFIINSGILETRGPVDRDNICANLEICVIQLAIKVQPTEFFAIIQVEVELVDVNDNTPQFAAATEEVTISESTRLGTFSNIPQADDTDGPQFSVQNYELRPASSVFRLHQETTDGIVRVELELLRELDREAEDNYSYTLYAYDGGSPVLSSSVALTITVSDSNDNRPVFTQADYDVSVPENLSSGVSVARVRATDNDTGANAVITYTFDDVTATESGSLFRLDPQSGQIFLRSLLDYETDTKHILTVLAKDSDPEYIGAVAKVTVNVMDYNDNRPSIKVNDLENGDTVSVPENEQPQHFVAHLTVVDLDSADNGEFECSIDSNEFTLERLYPTEFKIITDVSFDRETRSQYTIRMSCQDNGSPRQSSSLTIPVIIADHNDHPPIFQSATFVGSALESVATGAFIMRVSASDRDTELNSEIEYRIDGAVSETFNIGARSGNISAKVELDHELQSRYTFLVTAVDKGTPPLSATATVIVDVIDVDDNIPLFSINSYAFSVDEDESINSEVGQVTATDADSEPFDRFYYSMPTSDMFRIDNVTGMLYTRQVLDREAYVTPVFTTQVYAITTSFRPSTSTSMVTIHITDKNDNAPVIIFPNSYNNTIYITDSGRRGNVIGAVVAHDADDGNNARLVYRIVSGNVENVFLIDSTGAVMIHKDLATVNINSFGLDIRVEDSAVSPKHAQAFMNIVVNKSAHSSQDTGAKKTNLSIVISIACVSGCVIVILIVAIAFIILQRRRQRHRMHYNNVPKVLGKDPFMQITPVGHVIQEQTTGPVYGGGFENSGFANENQSPDNSKDDSRQFYNKQVSLAAWYIRHCASRLEK